MAKRRKPSVFEDDDGHEGDDGFMKYVQEKSARSKKLSKTDAAEARTVADQLVGQVSPIAADVPTRSKYISNLLDSKKQRELDRLHAQSVKVRLERQLEGSGKEEIITKGYEKKKESYEKADQLAERESNQEIREKQSSLIGASGMALKMLTSEPEVHTSVSSDYASRCNPNKAEIRFENDIYVNEAGRPSGQAAAQDDLDPVQKQILVEAFLKSKKTSSDIALLRKQYWERQNSH